MSSLHDRLKRTRKAQGLSQHQLADLCSVSQPTIANWERGGHIPRQKALTRLSERLNVDRFWLLSGERPAHKHPAQNHLTRPIQHIPVFAWTDIAQEFQNASPITYMAMSVDHGQDIFAVIAQERSDFEDGTVLIFDREKTENSWLLVDSDHGLDVVLAADVNGQTAFGGLSHAIQNFN